MMTFFRQTSLVTLRELRALLCSPLFYVLNGIFFLLTALVYIQLLVAFAIGSEDATVSVTDSVIRPTFHMIHFFLLVQIPLLTMRVFAEDQSTGMLDLLQTTPVKDWSLLLGKFKATWLAMGFYILLTFSYPLATSMLGIVEWPVVLGSVLALALSTSAYVAIGIFFSALTESQVIAAVLSYVAIFLFVFAQGFADETNMPALMDAARHFSVMEHVNGLLSGNIAPMNVVYFIALSAMALFGTARTLEARRWKS